MLSRNGDNGHLYLLPNFRNYNLRYDYLYLDRLAMTLKNQFFLFTYLITMKLLY